MQIKMLFLKPKQQSEQCDDSSLHIAFLVGGFDLYCDPETKRIHFNFYIFPSANTIVLLLALCVLLEDIFGTFTNMHDVTVSCCLGECPEICL